MSFSILHLAVLFLAEASSCREGARHLWRSDSQHCHMNSYRFLPHGRIGAHLEFYFLDFFPPLPSVLRSAFLALLAADFRHAANRSPGLNGLTLCAALLLSAVRPISQFACLYCPPGLKCSLIS